MARGLHGGGGMKNSVALLLLVAGACGAPEHQSLPDRDRILTDPSSSAVIWQGFDHAWTRGQDIGRLGSWVEMTCEDARCDAAPGHAAAGNEVDDARYTTRYTEVQSPHANFQSGAAALELEAVEGTPYTGGVYVRVPADPAMRGRGSYVVLLNGFDLETATAPRRLQQLEIRLDYVEETAGELFFAISVAVDAACAGVECPEAGTPFSYHLQVHYLVVAGDEGAFRLEDAKVFGGDDWGANSEIGLEAESTHTLILGDHRSVHEPAYAAGVVALRGFSLTLDAPHPMLQAAIQLRRLAYDGAGDGVAVFCADTFFESSSFEQSNPERDAGAVRDGRMFLTMLQFRDARSSSRVNTGLLPAGAPLASKRAAARVRGVE